MSAARLLAANLPAVACVIAAAVIAHADKDGWGWFLFVAVLFGSVSVVGPRADASQDDAS